MTIFLARLTADDPRMPIGNWHPFPPPDKGFYNLRRVQQGEDKTYRYDLYRNKRVYEGGQRRLLCMSRRVTRLRAEDGWQFQFLQEHSTTAGLVLYRPFAVIYDIVNGQPVVVGRRDVSDLLPTARSKAEALYIVRSMPDRWPAFVRIHIEYTETVLSS